MSVVLKKLRDSEVSQAVRPTPWVSVCVRQTDRQTERERERERERDRARETERQRVFKNKTAQTELTVRGLQVQLLVANAPIPQRSGIISRLFIGTQSQNLVQRVVWLPTDTEQVVARAKHWKECCRDRVCARKELQPGQGLLRTQHTRKYAIICLAANVAMAVAIDTVEALGIHAFGPKQVKEAFSVTQCAAVNSSKAWG
jgi:hypothetical protein